MTEAHANSRIPVQRQPPPPARTRRAGADAEAWPSACQTSAVFPERLGGRQAVSSRYRLAGQGTFDLPQEALFDPSRSAGNAAGQAETRPRVPRGGKPPRELKATPVGLPRVSAMIRSPDGLDVQPGHASHRSRAAPWRRIPRRPADCHGQAARRVPPLSVPEPRTPEPTGSAATARRAAKAQGLRGSRSSHCASSNDADKRPVLGGGRTAG